MSKLTEMSDADLYIRYYLLDNQYQPLIAKAIAMLVKADHKIAANGVKNILAANPGRTRDEVIEFYITASYAETTEIFNKFEKAFRARHDGCRILPQKSVGKIMLKYAKKKLTEAISRGEN